MFLTKTPKGVVLLGRPDYPFHKRRCPLSGPCRERLGVCCSVAGPYRKEDDSLYPLAERVIPEAMRTGIQRGYQSAEAQIAPEFGERYAAIVSQYEQEEEGDAAFGGSTTGG